MASSDPPEPCKSTRSEPPVFLSKNSYKSLTEDSYDQSTEYNGTEPCLWTPLIDFDQDITFNSTGIYSSSGSRADGSGAVYSSGQGNDLVDKHRDGDESSLFDAFDANENEVESPKVDYQIPVQGMEFRSLKAAEKCYYYYAENIGFKVRKGKVQREPNRNIKKRFLLCSCQGRRAKNESNQTKNKFQRKETRTGCNAHVQITLEDGRWVITELHLVHNHDLESRNQSSNESILDRDELCSGVFPRNIRSKHPREPLEAPLTDSKRAKEEGPSKVHTLSILDGAQYSYQTLQDVAADQLFEDLKTPPAEAWKPMSTTQGLEEGKKLPPVHPPEVFIPPQPQEEKEDTMSSNMQDWVFNHGSKEVEVKGTEEVQQTANDVGNISKDEILVKERVSELPLTSAAHASIPSHSTPLRQSVVGLPTPFSSRKAPVPLTTLTSVPEHIICPFPTTGSDLSPTLIFSPEIQDNIAPTTVQTPTLPIPTMTNVSTLVATRSSNQQPPPLGEHQGILRDEGSIPQTGPHTLAPSLAWIRETSIQVPVPGFSPAGSSILDQIYAKYGNIMSDCCFTSPLTQHHFLDSTVKIVKLMQQHTARELSDANFFNIYSTLSDLEKAGVKVDWLRKQFVAVKPLIHYAQAEAKKAMILTRLSAMKAEMDQLNHELVQSEAILRGSKNQMPDWLGVEDKLGKGLL